MAKKKHPSQKKEVVFHSQAQVLVSGKPVPPELVMSLIRFSAQHIRIFQDWIALDGSVGHLDSIHLGSTYEQVVGELTLLAKEHPFLDVAVSVMSGPPGTFTIPVVTFHLKEGTVKKSPFAHFGHPPPKRVKV